MIKICLFTISSLCAHRNAEGKEGGTNGEVMKKISQTIPLFI